MCVCLCVHYRAVQWDVNAEGGGGMGHYFQMSYCEEKISLKPVLGWFLSVHGHVQVI